MKRRLSPHRLVIACLIAAAASLPALAQNSADTNLRFRITLADVAPDGTTTESTYECVTLDRTATELLTGWRVPIPTKTLEPVSGKNSKKTPVVSYTYQNVGVTAMLEPRLLDPDRVRLKASIEVSGFERGEEQKLNVGAARLGTFQHRFDAVLDEGVPVTVSTVPKPGGGSMQVRIEAFFDG